jgi:hypothetical protein
MDDVLKLTAFAGPLTRWELPSQMSGDTITADVDYHFLEACLQVSAFTRFITEGAKGGNEGR